MATIEQMTKNANKYARMTLAQVRAVIQNSDVDTNLATAQAAQIEEAFLSGESREVKIAVFMAGLMANLVDED